MTRTTKLRPTRAWAVYATSVRSMLTRGAAPMDIFSYEEDADALLVKIGPLGTKCRVYIIDAADYRALKRAARKPRGRK